MDRLHYSTAMVNEALRPPVEQRGFWGRRHADRHVGEGCFWALGLPLGSSRRHRRAPRGRTAGALRGRGRAARRRDRGSCGSPGRARPAPRASRGQRPWSASCHVSTGAVERRADVGQATHSCAAITHLGRRHAADLTHHDPWAHIALVSCPRIGYHSHAVSEPGGRAKGTREGGYEPARTRPGSARTNPGGRASRRPGQVGRRHGGRGDAARGCPLVRAGL
jgi:hypothetical protein